MCMILLKCEGMILSSKMDARYLQEPREIIGNLHYFIHKVIFKLRIKEKKICEKEKTETFFSYLGS